MNWDPFNEDDQVKDHPEGEAWWDQALDKQISLKPKSDCKFCRLTKTTTPGEMRPWMGTLCDACGQPRMIHRPQHPHLIDAGNLKAVSSTWGNRHAYQRKQDCAGFEEPDFSLLYDQLNNILEASSGE